MERDRKQTQTGLIDMERDRKQTQTGLIDMERDRKRTQTGLIDMERDKKQTQTGLIDMERDRTDRHGKRQEIDRTGRHGKRQETDTDRTDRHGKRQETETQAQTGLTTDIVVSLSAQDDVTAISGPAAAPPVSQLPTSPPFTPNVALGTVPAPVWVFRSSLRCPKCCSGNITSASLGIQVVSQMSQMLLWEHHQRQSGYSGRLSDVPNVALGTVPAPVWVFRSSLRCPQCCPPNSTSASLGIQVVSQMSSMLPWEHHQCWSG